KDWFKRNTVVVCFENTAVSEGDIKNKRISWINGNVRYSTTHHGRSNRARFQIFEEYIGQLGWRRRRSRYRRQRRRHGRGRRCGRGRHTAGLRFFLCGQARNCTDQKKQSAEAYKSMSHDGATIAFRGS